MHLLIWGLPFSRTNYVIQFVGQAESKINQCIMQLGQVEAPVEEVCGPGADPKFDQLISALGHIARQKPKPLIDTVMLWRKAKGEAAATANRMAYQVGDCLLDCHANMS
jgi:furry protein family